MKKTKLIKLIFLVTILFFTNITKATINFANENARIILKDSNSQILLNPSSVLGWQDRSIIKNVTNRGLGDYNLKNYSGVDNAITYAEAPEELVFENSNAIIKLDETVRTNSNAFAYEIKNNSNAIIKLSASSGDLAVNNSNAIIKLDETTRTNSNAFAYGIKNNSNAITANNIKIFNTQQIYSSHTTIDDIAWYKSGFEVYPGKILALKTPITMSGQISLGGTLTLSSDLFLDSGTTFSSRFGFGQIYGNEKAIHLGGDLTITASNFMHIGSNTIIEGNGNSINLGENSQIFVDDNVTLTLRNVVVKNSKNGAGNPAIKLASNRSKLALDNMALNLSDDLYFDRGQFFAYNDVNINGTSSFIYRSTVPSYIKSGAHFKFNPGSTFDFRPSTTGTSELLAKDLLFMDDATSRITFDGCTFKTTTTGMRLTKGQVLFDNKVTLTSAAQLQLKSTGTWINTYYSSGVKSVNWSPDGRYLVTGGYKDLTNNAEIRIYQYNESSLTITTSQYFGAIVYSVNWSPDGRYLAAGGENNVYVYKFNNSVLTPIASKSYNYVESVNWSPDGHYLAVGIYTTPSTGELYIYNFDGSNLNFTTSVNYGCATEAVNWSPDGKYLAVGGYNLSSGSEIKIYSFDGSSLALVTSKNYEITVKTINWSPDGRFLAVGGEGPGIQIYNFNYPNLTLVTSLGSDNQIECVKWSSNGQYLAVGEYDPASGKELQIYRFNNSTLTLIDSVDYGSGEGADVESLDWSANDKFLAIGGISGVSGHGDIDVYTLQYGPENQHQAISNSIVFGNSSQGSNSDINLQLLAGSDVTIDGILNYDNINSTSIFSSDNARFTITGTNSKICFNPSTVNGWRDRSVIKNITGGGLGDYNLQTYAGPDKIITYAEAPDELVYNNSNAITKLEETSRANSNAFAFGIKNNSNSIRYQSDHFISVNNGKVTALGAINGTTNVTGRSLLSSPIDLQGGTLTLESDMILSNQTTIDSSGNFDLQGNALIFGGDLALPSNVTIKIVSSGVLDGQGNELNFAIGSKLIVDTGITLTLRNVYCLANGSNQIEMRNETSKLTLQNTSLCFDRNYSFTQGQLFIQDDVIVTGTSAFSYASTGTSYIAPHSLFYFDKNTTFSYSPRLTSRHALSERNLIKMINQTSQMYFDECSLQLPDSGWQLTNGTVYFNNKVKIYGQSNSEQSFELGNGNSNNDPDILLLSGANIENYGYIYTNFGS